MESGYLMPKTTRINKQTTVVFWQLNIMTEDYKNLEVTTMGFSNDKATMIGDSSRNYDCNGFDLKSHMEAFEAEKDITMEVYDKAYTSLNSSCKSAPKTTLWK